MQADKIPQRDADGRIIGLIGFATDITENRRAGEAQAGSRRSWSHPRTRSSGKVWMESLPVGIQARKALRLFRRGGHRKADEDADPPERAREESKILTRLAQGESVQNFETVRVRKDGKQIDVSASVSPLKMAAAMSQARPPSRATSRAETG
jgi:PAS domain-containing protein